MSTVSAIVIACLAVYATAAPGPAAPSSAASMIAGLTTYKESFLVNCTTAGKAAANTCFAAAATSLNTSATVCTVSKNFFGCLNGATVGCYNNFSITGCITQRTTYNCTSELTCSMATNTQGPTLKSAAAFSVSLWAIVSLFAMLTWAA